MKKAEGTVLDHAAASDRPPSLDTMSEVFRLIWGPRRHIGVLLDDATDTIAAAAARASRIKAERAIIAREQRILEVGCGFGLDARLLAETYGCIVTATDAESWRLDEARRLCLGVKGLVFERADHSTLPYDNNIFDLVWANETLSYSSELRASLFEVARVVKPGGRLAVSDYTCSGLIDSRQIMALNHTKHMWSPATWTKRFGEAGLQVQHTEDWTRHARRTYARLAQEMQKLNQENLAVRASIQNMRQRIRWIDRGAFGCFFAILAKVHKAG